MTVETLAGMLRSDEAQLDGATASSIREAPRRVVAVIPAYNEEKYIGSVVLQARRCVDQIVVVDDGSTDLTSQLAADAGAAVLRHPTRQGKGAAISTGLPWALEAGATAVVLLDADGQHRPTEIDSLLEPVLAGEADIVIGSRFIGDKGLEQVPGWRVFGQRALNAATTLGSGRRLTDSQSGFRVLSRQAASILREELRSSGFAIESEMQVVAHGRGLRIVERPIIADYHVPLKRNPLLQGLGVVNGLLKLVAQTRPLLWIGIPGLLVLAIGLLLGLNVISLYEQTHALALGYSLIALVLVLAGLLGLYCAITLHTLRAFFLEIRQR